MASNKDILNAQRFNRQRLVMAFNAGAPGGRELEPRSSATPLIAGTAIALVIMLASLALGRFSPSLPADWENNTLLVVKDEGTRYVTIHGRLRPVTNVASARLLAEAGSFQQATVTAKTLDGIERGTRVGLEDAPEELPRADSLVSQGWKACTSSSGSTATHIGSSPPDLRSAGHALVSAGGNTYLIANGNRYQIPTDGGDAVLLALGLDSEPIIPVDSSWLNLFTQASPVQPFSIPGAGEPVTTLSNSIPSATSGALLVVSDASGDRRFYVVHSDGGVARLSAVETAMYELGNPGIQAQEVSASDLSQATTATSAAPQDWPENLGVGITENRSACAVLHVDASGNARTAINSSRKIDNGTTIVQGGSGALVRATSGGTAGPVFLITDAGRAWALGGSLDDTIRRLGYTTEHVKNIPSTWVALIPTGPELSKDAVWKDVADK